MSSTHSHKRKNSHLFLQRKNSSSADMMSYEMNPMDTNDFDAQTDRNGGKSSTDHEYTKDREDIESQLIPTSTINWNLKKLPKYKRFGLLIVITLLILLALLILPTTNITKGPLSTDEKTKRSFTVDEVLKGEFLYDETSFHFIRPPSPLLSQDSDPGLYVTILNEDNAMKFVAKRLFDVSFLEDLGKTTLKYDNIEYPIKKLRVNYELNKMIIGVNIQRKYRHSSQGLYFIKDLNTNVVKPISPFSTDELVDISYAHFSPRYNFIYFVHGNNLYIQNSNSDKGAQQVTADGSNNIFNGKPDWIYEEEVLSSEQAVWWAPDDSKMLFARIDDTNVAEYNMPKYTTKEAYSPLYSLKYPKPGTENPTIDFYMLDLRTGTIFLINIAKHIREELPNFSKDLILYDVQWIDPETCIFKVTDRASKSMLVLVYKRDPESLTIVRTLDSELYGGWIEKARKILPIPPKDEVGRNEYGYVDVQTDINGYNHLFYFETVTSQKGKQLTYGEWEITGTGIVGYEYESDTVSFTANEIGAMSQHLYGVTFTWKNGDSTLRTLQNPNGKHDFYDFELSSSGRFAVMKSLGPNVPFTAAGLLQEVLDATSIPEEYVLVLSDNTTFEDTLSKYDLPQKSYRTMKIDDDVDINYVEIKPANMDPKRNYPILVSVYGGPGSQTYTTKHSVFFEEAICSGLDAIVLEIEPRGTGGKGWKFKKWAKERMGYWEPRDVVEVTKRYIAQNEGLIDEKRIAIWGWSYGGFSTLKSVEFDAGQVFKYAIAVAPVTNWTYYDSFYTERYMGDPEANHREYQDISALQNIKSFGNLERFLIMHGTADDNVHIQNTYEFLDQLDLLNVENYDMHIFPDSDHSIQFHNAQHIIFRKLYYWLKDAFAGHFDSSSS